MKKLLFAVVLLSTSFLLYGQQAQKKKFEWGPIFTVKVDYLKTDFTDWNELGISNDLQQITTRNKLGFGLGLLYKFNITDHFAIVPQTILSFQESQLRFDLPNQENHQERIVPTTLSLPLHFVFSRPINNKLESSILLGMRYNIDIFDYSTPPASFPSRPYPEYNLDLDRQSYALDLGIGMVLKTKKFNLKPELMYSLGLTNLKGNSTGDVFNDALAEVYQDRIAFRLLFFK